MQVNLFLGRANTGKSRAIHEALARHQQSGERAILIVPEQYTFEAERALANALGGLVGVQVLSFPRLNERLLKLHGQTRPFLSAQGHRMVIRRACLQRADSLAVFDRAAARPGFAGELQTVFTDFKRAGLSAAALAALVEKLPEQTALRGKLADFAQLYDTSERFLAERYLTMDDAANAARALLATSFVRGAHVYIDGLDRPSEQLFGWLSALIATAQDVGIALCVDVREGADTEVFDPDRLVVRRVRAIAGELGAPVQTTVFRQRAHACAGPLAYLEENLFAPDPAPYEGDASAVTLFGATDRVAEVEALGDAILASARRGVRYREMAVIVSDPAAYMPLVARAFANRDIPVFLDRKQPVTGHAAVDAMLSALRAVDGYAAQDVLRLAKSGYAGVSDDACEILELYLLRTGLRGNALTKPFTRGEVPDEAEAARAALVGPLLQLQKGLAAPPVKDKARALYDYLLDIGLEDALKRQAEALLEAGRVPLMEEHAQVWNTLMELLGQLDAIIGDVAVSRRTFYELVTEGLTGCEIGVIPGTSDQVLLGDLARTKSRAVRALFLVGVNDGLLPQARHDDALIDDAELAALARVGAPVWSNSKSRADQDRLELYTALSKGRETLFVSFCFSSDGMELAPSPLIKDLKQLFPHCARASDLDGGLALPESARAGLQALTRDLCTLHTDHRCTPRLPTLLAYYGARPDYEKRVRRMLEAGSTRFSLPPLGRALSAALYGSRIRMSASRLEQFSACPFKHFVRYGLAAADRQEFTERATDLGSFYHAAMEAFVRRAGAAEGGWAGVTEAQSDALVDALLPELIALHHGGIFLNNERLRATLFLLVDSVKLGARAIVRQVQSGGFTPLGAEARFGEGEAFPPIRLVLDDGTEALVSGIIDRVDGAGTGPDGQPAILRVVDYKLSGREFDFSGILSGLTLQLPLYLAAVTQAGATPGGMYYMPLRIPAVDEGEELEQALFDAFSLRGLTLSEPAIVLASDRGMKMGAPTVLKGVRGTEETGYTGGVCTRNEMARLLEEARAVSQRTLAAMLDGRMEIAPVEGACKYCDYRSVCRFDPMVRGCRTRRLARLRKEAFFAQIGGGDDELDP